MQMLVSPSYLPQKKSPRSVNVEDQLELARQRELAERNTKAEQKTVTQAGVQRTRTPQEIYQDLADNHHSTTARYRLAEILLKEGKLEDAFIQMKYAAEQDNRTAQCRLGEMYAHGIGTTKDEQSAIEWFDKAKDTSSDHYHPRALINLGVMRCMGRGTAYDSGTGFANLMQAERSSLSNSQGREKQFGEDSGEEVFYVEPTQVLPTALYLLSKKYAAMNQKEKSAHYLKRATDAGHALSQLPIKKDVLPLGKIDFDILKTEQFLEKINLEALKTEALGGCRDTAFFLGQLYCGTENLIEKEMPKAIYFFKLAEKAGHPEAHPKLQIIKSQGFKISDSTDIQYT